MKMILTPNIKFRNSKPINGKDNSPFRGYVLGRIGTGPDRKNFVMPNALENRLKRNVRIGRAWLSSVNVPGLPHVSVG